MTDEETKEQYIYISNLSLPDLIKDLNLAYANGYVLLATHTIQATEDTLTEFVGILELDSLQVVECSHSGNISVDF